MTLQQLLDDINLRYRNTFTDAQKVAWMNQVQRQIFSQVPHEATPYTFPTVDSQAWYPLPADCRPNKIRKVEIETATANDFDELPFRAIDDRVNRTDSFYSLVQQTMYLNPVPDGATAGRDIFIYYYKSPTELSSTALTVTPDLETEYQELLILGTLERIAGARKDVVMKNNYADDYAVLFAEYKREFYDNSPPRTRQIKEVYGW